MEKIVAYVLSWPSWRTKMDEPNVDVLSAERKRWKHISVLPGLWRLDSPYACYPRALGRNKVDRSLQDNVEIPYDWTEYVYSVGSSHNCHSVIQSGWRRKRCERRKTNGILLLHSRGSYAWTLKGWTFWRDKTTTSTSQNQMESVPERSTLDQCRKCSR